MGGTGEGKTILHFIAAPGTCVRQLWDIQSLVEAGGSMVLVGIMSPGTGPVSGRACASSNRKAKICFSKNFCLLGKSQNVLTLPR